MGSAAAVAAIVRPPVADDEDAAVRRRGLELDERRALAGADDPVRLLQQPARGVGHPLGAGRVLERRAEHLRRRRRRRPRRRSAPRSLSGPRVPGRRPSRREASTCGRKRAAVPRYSEPMRKVIRKFFADRGTHLAAMIAYFALLSFVPLLFLALSLLGLAGRFDESSFLIHELEQAFPGTSLDTILKAVRVGPEELGDARDRRRRRAALERALALQRARVGVQHRLRPPEPLLPAREGARQPCCSSARSSSCSRASSSGRSGST